MRDKYLRLTFSALVIASFISQASTAPPAHLLFRQPSLPGLAGNLFVPIVTHRKPLPGTFALLLWQRNSFQPDGTLVPTDWSVGEKTGLFPSQPLKDHQWGFQDKPNSSTAQVEGDAVGAYVNSKDLPDGSIGSKMMVTPEYDFPQKTGAQPFREGGSVAVSLELQVPTASDGHRPNSMAHVAADLLFRDTRSGAGISYGCTLFVNRRPIPKPGIALDIDSKNMMINGPITRGSSRITVDDRSAEFQNEPWRGWKIFAFSIEEAQFRRALADLRKQHPEMAASTDPSDYSLVRFHLNAEIHYENGPAELGWSMRNAEILVLPSL